MSDAIGESAWLTSALPGIGGAIKQSPDDFVVEEIPDREPTGAGRFVRALIEKRGISTPELLRRMGAALACPSSEFGVAGYKDAVAVTRQWVSAPAKRAADLARMRIKDVVLKRIEPDAAPIQVGDLRGNRFRVTVRGVADRVVAVRRADAILAELARRGVPNFFGPQRFGVRGESAEVGGLLVKGDLEGALDRILGRPSERELDPRAGAFRRAYEAGDLRAARDRVPASLRLEIRLLDQLIAGVPRARVVRKLPLRERRFFLSAWQSLLFNRILARRLPRIDVALRGDLLLLPSGPPRECVDPRIDQVAVEAFSAHPSAPLVGARVALANGEPGVVEREVIAASGVTEAELSLPAGLPLDGERRALRFVARDLVVRPGDAFDAIVVSFELPKGCFATALLSELTRSERPVV